MRIHSIEAVNLAKTYKTRERRGIFGGSTREVKALRGVSFRVERGEIFSLLGPNGAGKTTTVKILATLLKPDRGEAYVEGYSVLKEPEKVREAIGLTLTVEKGFYPKLTGFENLVYFAMLHHMPMGEAKSRAREVLELVGLAADADRLFEEYSLGMKAKLALARALIHDPSVLILDEPTIGLDPVAARGVRKLLVELKKRGKTIMLTTHNMAEAEMLSDHVAMLNRGRIVAYGTVEELKQLVSDSRVVRVEVPESPLGLEARLGNIGELLTVTSSNGVTCLRICCKRGEEMEVLYELLGKLRGIGVRILRAEIEEPSLEDVFVKLAGGES